MRKLSMAQKFNFAIALNIVSLSVAVYRRYKIAQSTNG